MRKVGDGATIVKLWGDGDHKFCLRLGEIRELQGICKAGIMDIMSRLRDWHWWVDDVRETIRLGLIGGGMSPEKAEGLTRAYVDDRPRMENVLTAYEIIAACMSGVKEDQPEKKETAEEETTTAGSASPPSTEQPPSSDGLHERSIN